MTAPSASRFAKALSGREHDLPPRWDGRPVRWSAWVSPRPFFLCPPPKASPCPECGSVEPRAFCPGLIDMKARASRFGLPIVTSTTIPTLEAFRCTVCAHDYVTQGPNTWDLDPDDYRREGSFA